MENIAARLIVVRVFVYARLMKMSSNLKRSSSWVGLITGMLLVSYQSGPGFIHACRSNRQKMEKR